ncbi:glycoside hydrolase family 1 protein [Polyangium fumosum]|uniref:Glycoside hydrolase family 1 protein n=1 Tax=Polyangium fumosum TaxID=889272 RepID=A0A4U1IWP9_9BACT|nr:glycoside hydrolase family 1 protein [Polyangium fumosum]TKC98993.1 glycoside hydrolase family 1 protein [Polyangium fumosum]
MNLARLARLGYAALTRDPHPPPCVLGAEDALSSLRSALPAGFLLGTATASHQIEGGLDNDWTDWERGAFSGGAPHIKDHTVSGAACDSWNRIDEDIKLLRQLGANAYRFSVEWSRLEPTEGAWNEEAADRYLAWALALRAAGIEPMVTLHHFTLPRWVATQGGWMNERTIDLLAAFSRRVAKKLGSAVDLWCTINEPNVLATLSYVKGIFPPGLSDQRIAVRVMARMLKAHARMTEAIRETDTTDADGDGHATRVGIAHHVRIFQPATRSPLDRLIAGFTDQFFNEAIASASFTGRIELCIPGIIEIDEAVPGLLGSYDYMGINYYGRDHVRADLRDPSLSKQYVPADRPVNDLGWDIYPEGLYQVLKRYGSLGLPVFVTENGIADKDGNVRPSFLRSHFEALVRAAREGIDVRGYFHWSLLDNFEWAEGYEPRFGLFRVDFESPEKRRTPTPAVETFQDIARGLGLQPDAR